MTYNVVLVTVDCLRFDRCGFNEYQKEITPFLDHLAEESITFNAAYATDSYTAGSFPGILAGLHEKNTAYVENIHWKALPANQDTIFTDLRNEGYRTVATVTNPHLSQHRFARGLDSFRNLHYDLVRGTNENKTEPEQRFIPKVSSYDLNTQLGYILGRARQMFGNWPTVDGWRVTKKLINELRNPVDTDVPFIGWAHFMEPHVPIRPSRARAFFGPTNPISVLYADSRRFVDKKSSVYGDVYDSSVKHTDNCIRELVSHLKNMNVWDETILIVTSDHGEALYDRGMYDHPQHYFYDELLHVPLLIRHPKKQSHRIQTLFSLVDLRDLITALIQRDNPDPVEMVEKFTTKTDDTVVSDTLSGQGYTIALRTAESGYIKHFGKDLYREYDPETVLYDHEKLSTLLRPFSDGFSFSDKGNKHIQDYDSSHYQKNNEIVQQYRTRFDDATELASTAEHHSSDEVADRLQDLGYR